MTSSKMTRRRSSQGQIKRCQISKSISCTQNTCFWLRVSSGFQICRSFSSLVCRTPIHCESKNWRHTFSLDIAINTPKIDILKKIAWAHSTCSCLIHYTFLKFHKILDLITVFLKDFFLKFWISKTHNLKNQIYSFVELVKRCSVFSLQFALKLDF